MKSYASATIVFLICSVSYAQRPNLVPNPGFENLIATPCDPMSGEISQYITGWQQGSRGTADILSRKTASSCYANPNSSHKIRIGSEDPHGGDNMGMIMTSVHSDYREYLGCTLLQPLQVGRSYYAEVYVSLAEYSGIATNNIGFLFQTGQYRIENGYQIIGIPQVNCTTVISTTTGWAKISGTFTADQPYTYFLIGNFLPEEQITRQKNNAALGHENYATHSAYYIDDVLVTRSSDFSASGDSVVVKNTIAKFQAKGGKSSYMWADVRNPGIVLSTDSVLRIKVDKKTTFRVTSGDEYIELTVNVKEQVAEYLTELHGRQVKRGRTIIVHSDVLEISVYDKYTEDGDSISLYYGDSLIVQHFVLMNEDSTFKIKIDKEHPKQIILFAENLGTSPPNTAAMVIDDGKKETDVSLTSDLESCDSFTLIYKEN